MAPEYQGKMCPVLTAGLIMRNGPGLASISCGEDACQHWWKCREPNQEEAAAKEWHAWSNGVELGHILATRQPRKAEPQAEAVPVPDIDDGRIEEYVDLEMMAKKLVMDMLAYTPLDLRDRPRMERLACGALREVYFQGWKGELNKTMAACEKEARDGQS